MKSLIYYLIGIASALLFLYFFGPEPEVKIEIIERYKEAPLCHKEHKEEEEIPRTINWEMHSYVHDPVCGCKLGYKNQVAQNEAKDEKKKL